MGRVFHRNASLFTPIAPAAIIPAPLTRQPRRLRRPYAQEAATQASQLRGIYELQIQAQQGRRQADEGQQDRSDQTSARKELASPLRPQQQAQAASRPAGRAG